MQHFWTAIFATLTFIAGTSSSKVVLENKPGCDSCNWVWNTFKAVNAQVPGWVGRSNPARYSVCDVSLSPSVPRPNSWLRSDLITVNGAKRIDITVEYFIRSCSYFPPNNGGPYCENVFDVYVNQSDNKLDQYPDPLNNTAAYEKVAELQVTGVRTVETINVLVKGKYVILAFHDYGSCNSLYSVKVTYNVCAEETLRDSLVSLPRTVAPANDSESIQVEGNCENNTVQEQGSLSVHCDSNGEWNISGLQGRCICKENMQNVGGKCVACPDGKYNDQNGLNCTVLPSMPKNIHVMFVNQSTVVIRWLPPAITGDQTHVSYDVECRKPCDLNGDDNKCMNESCGCDVTYIPNKEGLNVTEVMIANLSTFVNYTFKIYAMNRASEVAKRRHGVEANFTIITVRTNGSVPGTPEVSVEQPTSVVIVSWALEQKNGIIKDYHVTYIREDDSLDSKTLTTQKMEQRFEDLMAGKTYEFQVFAVNDVGRGPTGVKTFTLKIKDACPEGRYNDQNGLNCTVLPSMPRNVHVLFVNQSTVVIRWLPPAITGDETHVFYDVKCRKPCDDDHDNKCDDESCGSDVTYIPYKDGLNVTEVMITNLSTFVNYTIKIYAMNRVSEVAKRRHGVEANFTTITVRTNGSIPGKPEVSVEQPKSAVIVSWTLEQKNGIIKDYHVTYTRDDDSSDNKTITTQKMEQRFEDLMAGETYEFQVFAVNDFGRGPTGLKTFTLKHGARKRMMNAFLKREPKPCGDDDCPGLGPGCGCENLAYCERQGCGAGDCNAGNC